MEDQIALLPCAGCQKLTIAYINNLKSFLRLLELDQVELVEHNLTEFIDNLAKLGYRTEDN